MTNLLLSFLKSRETSTTFSTPLHISNQQPVDALTIATCENEEDHPALCRLLSTLISLQPRNENIYFKLGNPCQRSGLHFCSFSRRRCHNMQCTPTSSYKDVPIIWLSIFTYKLSLAFFSGGHIVSMLDSNILFFVASIESKSCCSRSFGFFNSTLRFLPKDIGIKPIGHGIQHPVLLTDPIIRTTCHFF